MLIKFKQPTKKPIGIHSVTSFTKSRTSWATLLLKKKQKIERHAHATPVLARPRIEVTFPCNKNNEKRQHRRQQTRHTRCT